MLQIGNIAGKTMQVPSDTSRGDSTTVSPKTCTFYSTLRDQHHYVSTWLPTDHQNPVPTVLPLTPSWNGNKSKAVLPGSAWRGTHSSASASQQHARVRHHRVKTGRSHSGEAECRAGRRGPFNASQTPAPEMQGQPDSRQAEHRAAPLLSYCSTSLTAKCTHCLHRSCAPC